MYTKKLLHLILYLSFASHGFSQTSCSLKPDISGFEENHHLKQKSVGAPVKIFYGLNESHSKCWAQCSCNGLVGISYFKKTNQCKSEPGFSGDLIYKSIQPDGAESEEIVTSGIHLEVSSFLFDTASAPHIFLAESNDTDQVIRHYFKTVSGQWTVEDIIHFYNEGGKYIYELSTNSGPDNSFHLLVLKTRSNPDSYDYYNAYINSHLYHISNSEGIWTKELIQNYDMVWTLDEYSKMLNRQDIEVDKNNKIHVVFGEQVGSASRLRYATNASGKWVIETAVDYASGSCDNGGWYPSLCLDKLDQPYVSCAYVARVSSGSAISSTLLFVKRSDNGWIQEIIADRDDGYYGTDGRNYTGSLSHLVFDKNNTPHIIFSDIASSHENGRNYWNLGYIRHVVRINDSWEISTVYSQPLPNGFFNATEMYGMCLLVSDSIDRVQLVGQELVLNSANDYNFNLIQKTITNSMWGNELLNKCETLKIYPNPVTSNTVISFYMKSSSDVKLTIHDTNGKNISTLISEKLTSGQHSIVFNAGQLSNGIYYCTITTATGISVMKMVLIN
jgi:hypothetical protein